MSYLYQVQSAFDHANGPQFDDQTAFYALDSAYEFPYFEFMTSLGINEEHDKYEQPGADYFKIHQEPLYGVNATGYSYPQTFSEIALPSVPPMAVWPGEVTALWGDNPSGVTSDRIICLDEPKPAIHTAGPPDTTPILPNPSQVEIEEAEIPC